MFDFLHKGNFGIQMIFWTKQCLKSNGNLTEIYILLQQCDRNLLDKIVRNLPEYCFSHHSYCTINEKNKKSKNIWPFIQCNKILKILDTIPLNLRLCIGPYQCFENFHTDDNVNVGEYENRSYDQVPSSDTGSM